MIRTKHSPPRWAPIAALIAFVFALFGMTTTVTANPFDNGNNGKAFSEFNITTCVDAPSCLTAEAPNQFGVVQQNSCQDSWSPMEVQRALHKDADLPTEGTAPNWKPNWWRLDVNKDRGDGYFDDTSPAAQQGVMNCNDEAAYPTSVAPNDTSPQANLNYDATDDAINGDLPMPDAPSMKTHELQLAISNNGNAPNHATDHMQAATPAFDTSPDVGDASGSGNLPDDAVTTMLTAPDDDPVPSLVNGKNGLILAATPNDTGPAPSDNGAVTNTSSNLPEVATDTGPSAIMTDNDDGSGNCNLSNDDATQTVIGSQSGG